MDGARRGTRAAPALAARAARRALDALLPPRCLACGAQVGEAGAVCPACWRDLSFIDAPFCACCGLPFEHAVAEDSLCGGCARERPRFRTARAVLRYDDDSRGLILGFKHGDRTHGARAYAEWMARAGRALIGEADLIVPVPLHWTRLVRRRYNQAALLAHAVSRLSGRPAAVDAMVRRRPTPSQGRLTAAQRWANVRGAFAVRPRRRDAIEGRRVLLIDDVLTTGATAEACTRALMRAGAESVDVLVLARVVRGATAFG